MQAARCCYYPTRGGIKFTLLLGKLLLLELLRQTVPWEDSCKAGTASSCVVSMGVHVSMCVHMCPRVSSCAHVCPRVLQPIPSSPPCSHPSPCCYLFQTIPRRGRPAGAPRRTSHFPSSEWLHLNTTKTEMGGGGRRHINQCHKSKYNYH